MLWLIFIKDVYFFYDSTWISQKSGNAEYQLLH